MKPGLVSITFRHLPPEQIIQLAKEEKFSGIEWGGDIHVPHGDLNAAYSVGLSTRKSGLETAAKKNCTETCNVNMVLVSIHNQFG